MSPPLSDDGSPDTSTPPPIPGATPCGNSRSSKIKRKRAFQRLAVAFAAASVFLIVIWAVGEYNNAGGWPSDGFSQSSGTSHVWNIWMIYPILGMELVLAIDAWFAFRHRPISEREIQREIDRLTEHAGGHRRAARRGHRRRLRAQWCRAPIGRATRGILARPVTMHCARPGTSVRQGTVDSARGTCSGAFDDGGHDAPT